MNLRPILPALVLAAALPCAARAALSVSIDIAPPPLPVYVQPAIPAPGYLWTPGYWRWDPVATEYFWVPGTWIAPPYAGALWTPGYWGWGSGGYAWHGGYWGPHVGFYGGVNYGFGYVGHGYAGGYWNGGVFSYNRAVNNVDTTIVHNVYNTTVIHNDTHVSYNGGQGGVAERPTAEEQAARAEPHAPPTPLQRQHEQVAMRTPEQRVSFNHGAPSFVATARAADLRSGGDAQAMRVGHPGAGAAGMPGHPHGGDHAMAAHEPHRQATAQHPHPDGGPRGEHHEGAH